MIKNIIILLLLTPFFACNSQEKMKVPNILICIADDAGHMGKNHPWVKTPAFDRVANQGIRFSNAYTPNAKCAPSRASLLTARNSWQLKEAANHWNNFSAEFNSDRSVTLGSFCVSIVPAGLRIWLSLISFITVLNGNSY